MGLQERTIIYFVMILPIKQANTAIVFEPFIDYVGYFWSYFAAKCENGNFLSDCSQSF